MKATVSIFGTSLLIGSLSLIMACSDGSRTRISAPTEFALRFHASLGTRVNDISCSTPLEDLGTTAANGTLLDLAFFIHGLEFVRADGSSVSAELSESEWQSQNVALLDFQDRADSCSGESKPTNLVVKGQIADAEDIVAVRFTLGVPPALNHVDPQSVKAPLNAANMFWSWQGGYKSLRLDISPEDGITRPSDPDFLGTNYFLHLGSTDCSGDPVAGEAVTCGRVNQPLVALDNFQLGSSEVVLDIGELLAGQNLKIDLTDTPGCMSATTDVECALYFQKLGMDLESGASESDLSQSAFRLK